MFHDLGIRRIIPNRDGKNSLENTAYSVGTRIIKVAMARSCTSISDVSGK